MTLRVIGARTHNLKNVTVDIPRDQLVVVTGRSGSGKSSLAFDTIYAEGQRQYIESLSIFSRQFFNQLPRPDVDSIEGLQPTLCLDQNNQTSSRRRTVGTITEIYDYLRVLMARVGEIRCSRCGVPIHQHSPQQIQKRLLELPERTKIMILAPMNTGQLELHQEALKKIRRERLVRVRVDGEIHDIDQVPVLGTLKNHAIDAIADRIIIRDGIDSRLLEAIDNAVRLNPQGHVICCWRLPTDSPTTQDRHPGECDEEWHEQLYSTQYACPQCDIRYDECQPRSFNFNSPMGACDRCNGLGQFVQFDPQLTVDRSRSIDHGAIKAWASLTKKSRRKQTEAIEPILHHLGCSSSTRLDQLASEPWDQFLNSREKGRLGLSLLLQKELATTASEARQDELEQMQAQIQCEACHGARVSQQARSVFVGEKHIGEIVDLPIDDACHFFANLNLDENHAIIAEPLLREIRHRLTFLQKVGVGYLTLGRAANTLSGGEQQRVRLASSIGSGVTAVCFVLDEPSIGLHHRDNERLIGAIRDLQHSGNSVIVVEHDESMIRSADHVIDMGPGAGRHGGEIIAQGTAHAIANTPASITGDYLAGRIRIEPPAARRPVSNDRWIRIRGATGHNLKSLDVDIPLSVFCCITGVSGSGKSTLINQTVAPAIARNLELVARTPEPYSSISGLESIDYLIEVNQKPIGRTPRACPATYSGVFQEFRNLFAATKMAKRLGFGVGRFSFNTKTGWCPDCQGHGVRKMSMNFLPDIYTTCETCRGKRFNLQTLQIRFSDLTISDVLDLTVDQAIDFFDGFSKINRILKCLADVGLGYLLLGQSATTLSGGEAQRIKLATELAKPNTGNTVYILDEPTTGLHFEDIRILIQVLNQLVDQGNSMIVIEHNLDVIRCADWVIDLGPEGGTGGGSLMGAGTPEMIAEIDASPTGQCLKALPT